MKGKIKFVNNIMLNSGSTFAYIVLLQIIILPILSRFVNPERFGEIITGVAIINGLGLSIGGSITQLVIKKYGDYKNKSQHDDQFRFYNSCFIIILIIASPLLIGFEYYLLQPSDVTLVFLATFLCGLKGYLFSELRINYDYLSIAYTRVAMLLGYCVASIFVYFAPSFNAIIIFMSGELFAVLYLALKTSILSRGIGFERTALILKQYFGMLVSLLSNNLVAYGDRFILSKFIGYEAASIFFAGALGGRLAQMPMNSISNVLLSLLINQNKEESSKICSKLIVLGVVISIVAFTVLELVFPYLIKFLYPAFYPNVQDVLFYINIGFAVKIGEISIRPSLIRFVRVKRIAEIDGAYGIIYLTVCTFSAILWDLKGFAIAIFVLSVFKYLMVSLHVFNRLIDKDNGEVI